MLDECFEMESRTTPTPRSRLTQKVLAEELELRDLPTGKAVSCWWMTLPIFCYLAIIAGGVMCSIAVGGVTAAFDPSCIFFANVTLKGLDLLNNSKILTRDNVEVNDWGDMDSCLFPEYTSVACVMYAGILLVMVLNFGRGGGKSAFRGRGVAESWRIVPVAFLFNLIFLILSSIIFGNIQNGFSTFCDGINQQGSSRTLGNVSRCADVLKFTFPWDKYNTNLHLQYVLSKVGAALQLGGSLLAFLTIIIRCCIPADFIVYRRRKIMMTPGIQYSSDEERSVPHTRTTSVECHGQPDTLGINNETDSIHSYRSDTNLVPQSGSSRTKHSQIRISN
ncbi:hypothetical protein Ocin01_10689 [Orchesella cincta]|uniref:Transmembrane protein n=1 Tax=Orchesella cincta TaxID=48709 RepID=A0A1D2MSK5_ORCCI|nr:hypothetical protein Ocin01_10689 [Orchesella cincta]